MVANQRTPDIKYFIILVVAFLIIICSLPIKANASVKKECPELFVGATGTVTIAPDQARISLTVTNIEKSLAKAQDLNNQSTQNVISVLAEYGVDEKDIETVNYNIYPQYNYNSNSSNNNPPQITGYQINNEISVVVKKLDQVGKVLDAAVKAGANNVNYISFEKGNISAQENEALAKAVAKARSKAETIATAAGMTLGKVTQISAEGINTIFPDIRFNSKNDLAEYRNKSEVPITPGDLKITANIYMSYELQ